MKRRKDSNTPTKPEDAMMADKPGGLDDLISAIRSGKAFGEQRGNTIRGKRDRERSSIIALDKKDLKSIFEAKGLESKRVDIKPGSPQKQETKPVSPQKQDIKLGSPQKQDIKPGSPQKQPVSPQKQDIKLGSPQKQDIKPGSPQKKGSPNVSDIKNAFEAKPPLSPTKDAKSKVQDLKNNLELKGQDAFVKNLTPGVKRPSISELVKSKESSNKNA
jgi:hypothetical protein